MMCEGTTKRCGLGTALRVTCRAERNFLYFLLFFSNLGGSHADRVTFLFRFLRFCLSSNTCLRSALTSPLRAPPTHHVGKHTGRAAKDKYFVDEPGSRNDINWSAANQRMSEEAFEWLHRKATAYLQNRSVYVMVCRNA